MLKVKQQYSLKNHNTLRLATVAAHFVRVTTVGHIEEAIRYAVMHGLTIFPIGEGSNVVLQDVSNALVLSVNLSGIKILQEGDNDIVLRVAAGEQWHSLVEMTVANGWFGLENLALIPGTAGAAPVQNIGAYGVEISEFIEAVHYLEINQGDRKTFAVHVLDKANCQFAYRDSIFKQTLADKALITAIDLRLSKTPALNLRYPALIDYFAQHESISAAEISPQQLLDAVVAIRRAKLPDVIEAPNAGSFFKNPIVDRDHCEKLLADYPTMPNYAVRSDSYDASANNVESARLKKLSAGWLIEQAGYKGRRDGGIGMDATHALVLTNLAEEAKAEDILRFAAAVKRAVHKKFGVLLEIEPRVVNFSA